MVCRFVEVDAGTKGHIVAVVTPMHSVSFCAQLKEAKGVCSHLFIENGTVDDSSFDKLVNWKSRCDTTAIEDDCCASTHLGELAPIDFAISKVALDFVDNSDILEMNATRYERSCQLYPS